MGIDLDEIGKGIAFIYIAAIILLVVVILQQLIGCK